MFSCLLPCNLERVAAQQIIQCPVMCVNINYAVDMTSFCGTRLYLHYNVIHKLDCRLD